MWEIPTLNQVFQVIVSDIVITTIFSCVLVDPV